jgi:outer membrane protein OmpA-like peptidoglycan-associated protein
MPAKRPPKGSLLDLQRSAGNFAVQGLLDSAEPGIAHALGHVPPSVATVISGGGGRPLEPDVRADVEQLVGDDLSDVRVHDDAAAAESAEAAGARAYTAGEHVVFGPGRYAPQTGAGRALLAHELGHVVAGRQQGAGTAPVLRDPKDRVSVKNRASLLSGVPAPRVSRFGSSTIATIYFARDNSLMDAAGLAAVEKLAEQLSFMAKPMVSVDGYASTEGQEKRNEELGQMRRNTVVAMLAWKAPGVAVGGQGHGALEPAVPETATDAAELEVQRAQNRRATIVIIDLTAPTPAGGTPGGGEKSGKQPVDIFKGIATPEETEEEAANRRLKEMMKLPSDLSPPKKSFSEQFWKVVDDKLDSTMSNLGVPQKYRGLIKDGAHSAIEKGAETILDSALDAAHLSADEKSAIKSAVKAAAQTKF